MKGAQIQASGREGEWRRGQVAGLGLFADPDNEATLFAVADSRCVARA